MKQINYLFIVFSLVNSSAFAQMDSLWSRTFGGANNENCLSVQQTSDGGYILGGFRYQGGSDYNFWLIKTYPDGNSFWSHAFGGAGQEICRAVQQTLDGGYILAGEGTSSGDQEFWVVKTDANGYQVWARFYRGANEEICRSVQQTADGGYILAGNTNSFGAGNNDFWLVKTNSNGDSLWSRTFGGMNDEVCNSVYQTSDGGYILAGVETSFGAGYADFWMVKTNANGDSLWSRTFGGVGTEGNCNVETTADGGYILAGYTASFGAGGFDFWLVKTNSNGDSLWSRTFGGMNDELCNSVLQTSDGGYMLAGYTNSFGTGFADSWLVMTDENGDSLWSDTYGGADYDYCNSARLTSDRGCILAGLTQSFGAGQADFWLLKTMDVPPHITSITDVGNNQGRNVRLRWNRSGYDGVIPGYPVTGYSVYRRIDQYLFTVERPQYDPALDWPPGEWEYISTVPAFGEETYVSIVPTLADSSSAGIYWSVFFLRAATSNPLLYFDSPVDSGYSVDNLAPDPTLLVANLSIQGGNLILHWEAVSTGGGGQPEQNGIWYRVHGSSDPGFLPAPGNLLTTTQNLSYTLPLDQNRFYFKVQVSDDH